MPAAKRDVRGTVWFGRTRSSVASTQHAATSTASDHVPNNQTLSHATSGLTGLPPQPSVPNPAPREILARNPCEIYEPCAGIYYGRILVLARHRQNKANLVHIQMQAVERSAIEMCVQMIDRLAHCSIPRLLDVFQYADRFLLVWEPFECTLHEALALSCRITESEVAQILWPVFKCLQFLRGQSRELASLTPRDILFTEEGEIKIAGIENSRHVDPSRADAMTSTLNALRSILEKIMQKNGSNFTWSQEIRSFKSALAKSTSARCLDKLLQHTFFEQVVGGGGLKVLVELANKTIFYTISFPPEDSLAKTGPLGKPVEPSTVYDIGGCQ
ncbi:uncharacterized protein AKAW2_50439S [Aspergillus luchuensis]|uniref:Protein kinase domain-containing protein n=1 Tax=Aspergillus kawachii TaxID=1069201 RepID=A0A7R8A0S7_ASPKA|nr:uncharacterized protein AKAW2_50439S [Aspergillus luchuensis]KAI3050644.1 hypothetical protein CBS147353_11633 [Aspergillus niger]BCS00098.1 hypothetical protein AKAW2_50439S [Aspergillus luchuensis]GAA89005.1 hypothetical protein AKAW_07119 [Aspergillus luchuensis IFO 4308]